MTPSRFCRYVLRTPQVASAGAFYDAVIGGRGDGITELPPEAAARGAPAHWLGYLDASALGGAEAVAARWIARGAARLGPPRPQGPALLRDPGGVIVALTDEGGPSRAGVAWHQLHTPDATGAAALLAELLGWAVAAPRDLGPEFGTHRELAWRAGEPSAGAISDITGRPSIHPHWLYYFGVPSIDAAIAAVRAGGGTAIGPRRVPGGPGASDALHIAVCEDPQGAAFGLREIPPAIRA